MSRGTARSRKNIGRPRLSRIADSTWPRVTRGSGLEVALTTTSARGTSLESSSQGTARPQTQDASSRARDAVAGEERARLSRSDDQHLALGQVAEHLHRELEPDGRDGQRMPGDLRFRADAFTRRDGALEEAVHDGPRRPGFARETQCLPHL